MKSFLKTVVSFLIVIFSIVGICDASYLTYNDVMGIVPPCRPPFACDAVLKSSWSHIGVVPLSAVGIIYYLSVLIFGVLNFGEVPLVQLTPKAKFRPRELLMMLTSAGILFSAYLVSVMAFKIKAWCLYCLISASVSSILFLLSLALQRLPESEETIFISSYRRRVFSLLYAWFAKPLFFLFDAEFVHNQMTQVGSLLGKVSILRSLTKWLFGYANPKLQKKLNGINFPNPVGLSAGFDYDALLPDILPSVGFGFATIGTVTLEAYAGNMRPQLGRFPRSQALLVNKGFKSLGANAIVEKLADRKFTIPIGISIGSTNKMHASLVAQIADILNSFTIFEKSKCQHSYYELNISCPNTTGGQPFTSTDRLQKLLLKLDALKIKRPVYVKMPIDLTEAETLALLKTTSTHTIAGVIFGNLTKDKSNPDVDPIDREVWKTVKGYLSGKPTQARSDRCIALTKKHFKSRFTIIGTGGIFTPDDARRKFELGADLVQLITGMIYQGPGLIGEINESLIEAK